MQPSCVGRVASALRVAAAVHGAAIRRTATAAASRGQQTRRLSGLVATAPVLGEALLVKSTQPAPTPAPAPAPAATRIHVKKNGKPYPPASIYRYHLYRAILSQPFVLILQQLNLTSADWRAFQRDVVKLGPPGQIHATMVQGKIFRRAGVDLLKETAGPSAVSIPGHPSPYVPDKLVKRAVGMGPFLVGPCVAVSGPVAQDEIGARISGVVALLNRHKKLALLGGQVEGTVFSLDELVRVSKLPSVGQMRAELLGLLQEPARQLVAILERSGGQELLALLEQHQAVVGSTLVGVLDAHGENLKGGAKQESGEAKS